LTARWKGFASSDDTIEPLHLAATHHKRALQEYLKKNKKLVTYIKANKARSLLTTVLDRTRSATQINLTQGRAPSFTSTCNWYKINLNTYRLRFSFWINIV
jgi:hypothetical protein